ncbi:MarR family winged helix-turn-helix transcriptional regulator [Nonomuraea sp. NPDC050790]|uniref:MarR family winged helix-turn-helix transcriptional regulator n=1 Tax=Nonomuraea sp. NPDC050790 TaxID=3364371 RepID=UPI003790B001
MEKTPARLRRVPSRLLALAAAQADRVVSSGLAELDARKWHYSALVALHESGPASQAELSDRTGIYRSDLVTVINELAERGLVARTPDPEDRRRNVISLTEAGRERFVRLDEALAAMQDELMSPLTAAEREQLVDLLLKLVLPKRP